MGVDPAANHEVELLGCLPGIELLGVRGRLVGGGREGQLLKSKRSWNSGYDWSRVVLLRRDLWGKVPELELEEDGEACPAGTGFR